MEMNNKNYNKLNILRQYVMNFVVMLAFWGGILRTNYNADSLNHMFSEDADAFINLCDGRYIIALCDTVLLKLGMRTTDNIRVSELLALLLFTGAVSVLQQTFSKWEPENILYKIAYRLAVSFAFLNVLFSEVLMFSEMSVYSGFAYLMVAIAVNQVVNNKYVVACIPILLAACTYQYSVIFATIALVFYIFLDNEMKLSWNTIKKYIGAVAFGFGSGFINLVSIKVLSLINIIPAFRKDMGAGDAIAKLKAFGNAQIYLLSSCYGLLPKVWIPLLALLVPVLVILIIKIKEHKIGDFFHLVLILLASEIFLNLLPLMNVVYGFPGRMAFCIFLVIGMTYVVMSSINNKSDILKMIMSYLLLGIVLANMLFSQFIMEDKYVTNTLDETYASMFVNELYKYEAETGNTITSIVVGYDDFAPIYYDRINFGAAQINERTTTIAASLITRYISDRYFVRMVMDDATREELFHNKNWDEWDADEQVVFIGDTAYWCMF